jgi:hypothetical protein
MVQTWAMAHRSAAEQPQVDEDDLEESPPPRPEIDGAVASSGTVPAARPSCERRKAEPQLYIAPPIHKYGIHNGRRVPTKRHYFKHVPITRYLNPSHGNIG